MLRQVWGPERVGEAWLLRNVAKRLRGKLGDDADNPRHIITEPRVGYRMATGEMSQTEEEREVIPRPCWRALVRRDG